MSSSAIQVQRFDIKKGVSQKMASHLNEKSTWQSSKNFRFYKGAIRTVQRTKVVMTLVPEIIVIDVPKTQACNITA